MRIIDDSRYLGNDLYPAIIPAETYEEAHLLKDQKNTQKEIDRTAGIFRLAVPVICPNCGNEMHRRHDSRWKVPQRWGCHNSECKTIIKLSDTDLLQSITNILNRIISQPDIIEMSIDTNEVGNDIRRLNMEIAHALETCSFNKEDLRKKMLTCVSLKYKGIDSATYTANRLKADFEKSSPLSAFSAELCRRTVKSIQLKNGRHRWSYPDQRSADWKGESVMMQTATMPAPKSVRTIPATIDIQSVIHQSHRRLRVAAYCRVSTKQEEQLNSYEVQKKYYEDRIRTEPKWSLVGIFADKGITGTSMKKRDEFNKMLRLCQERQN